MSGNISVQNGQRSGTLSQNQYAYEKFTLKDDMMYAN